MSKPKAMQTTGGIASNADLQAYVQEHPDVGRLDLAWARRVTNKGVQHLGALRRLWLLNLEGTGVKDGRNAPKSLPESLTHVDLRGTDIGDQWVQAIPEKVIYLNLTGTAVTDASVGFLAGLSELVQVTLGGTAITERGCAELRRRRPRLKINLE